MARFGALIDVLILAAVVNDFQAVLSCGGGSNKNDTSTGTPPSTTTVESKLLTDYIRCKVGSVAVCRPVKCNPGEKRLSSPGNSPFPVYGLCEDTTFYEMCYDYTKDGANAGTCQPDYLGCTGPYQKVLASTMNDKTCGKFAFYNPLIVRCYNKQTKNIICRPEKARCLSEIEDWDQSENAYYSEPECQSASGTELVYYRCVSGTIATCRNSTTGCDQATETRSPATVGYTSQSKCEAAGAPLYDLCYDFTATPTTSFGTCQPVEIGCTGKMKYKITAGTNEPNCAHPERDTEGAPYLQCQVNDKPTVINCRPAAVLSCSPDGSETKLTVGIGFSTSMTSCEQPLFDICYDYTDTPTSKLGACVAAGSSCSALPKFKIDSFLDKPTCSAKIDAGAAEYIRCMVSTSVYNCRPSEVVNCYAGESLQPNTDVLAYPNLAHDVNYGRNQFKTWTIRTCPEQRIRFRLTFLDVSLGPICFDFVRIHDGPLITSPGLTGFICGRNGRGFSPNTYWTTTGPVALITFRSSFTFVYKGFTLEYEFISRTGGLA